mmetsp:Transcript_21620/g.51639  ORF Transcript_21620/g.51639 Transcript_21620/m.51639 type:complete len:215 (-) Transcript_21620:2646-3290(-)
MLPTAPRGRSVAAVAALPLIVNPAEGLKEVVQCPHHVVCVVNLRIPAEHVLAEVGEMPQALDDDVEKAVVLADPVHQPHSGSNLRVFARQLRQLRCHRHREVPCAAAVAVHGLPHSGSVLEAGGNRCIQVRLLLVSQTLLVKLLRRRLRGRGRRGRAPRPGRGPLLLPLRRGGRRCHRPVSCRDSFSALHVRLLGPVLLPPVHVLQHPHEAVNL